MTINERVSPETLDKIIEAADDFITALAVTTEDDSTNMRQLLDGVKALNATPEIVKQMCEIFKAMARELQQYRAAAEPVAFRWRWKDDGMNKHGEWIYHDMMHFEAINRQPTRECQLVYAAPQVTSVPDEVIRDALRYRFLRDKDAFGCDNEPGLAGWDDLVELEMNAFDAAIDARMAHSNVGCAEHAAELTSEPDADFYAELHKLRAEIKGPDGFDTWKDAAIAEKKVRVELERLVKQSGGDIDYLGAMAAFHSDEWHKMGPITGYMHGWNACRAAMLSGGKS